MEDSEIITLFFERSEQALAELDKSYGKAARKTAANILSNQQDVEECVNDAFWGVWNSIPPHRPNSLISFFCKITRNLAVNRVRIETAAKRNDSFNLVLEEMEEFIPSRSDVEADYEGRELADTVNRFLSELSYDDRYIFVRRYWYADSVKNISTAMHCRENHISVRLFRLRKNLRFKLKKEGWIL